MPVRDCQNLFDLVSIFALASKHWSVAGFDDANILFFKINDQDSQYSGISGNDVRVFDAAVGLSSVALPRLWVDVGSLDIRLLVPGEEIDNASFCWSLLFLPLHRDH